LPLSSVSNRALDNLTRSDDGNDLLTSDEELKSVPVPESCYRISAEDLDVRTIAIPRFGHDFDVLGTCRVLDEPQRIRLSMPLHVDNERGARTGLEIADSSLDLPTTLKNSDTTGGLVFMFDTYSTEI
jgi:hypothetical protein